MYIDSRHPSFNMSSRTATDRTAIESHELAAETVAFILAGGKGTRLGALTANECKPALPFGGLYRNIDFSLSNCINSGIDRIGVATQYQDASLLVRLSRSERRIAPCTRNLSSSISKGFVM